MSGVTDMTTLPMCLPACKLARLELWLTLTNMIFRYDLELTDENVN